jgi:hypothetical protein
MPTGSAVGRPKTTNAGAGRGSRVAIPTSQAAHERLVDVDLGRGGVPAMRRDDATASHRVLRGRCSTESMTSPELIARPVRLVQPLSMGAC